MLKLNIDPRSGTPIYLQIVEQIRNQIQLGALAAGAQLPTVRAIAQDLRINFNTVSRAYRILHDAGVITTMQGKGTFILAAIDDRATAVLKAEQMDEAVEAFLDHLTKLGATPAQIIQMVTDRVYQIKESEQE